MNKILLIAAIVCFAFNSTVTTAQMHTTISVTGSVYNAVTQEPVSVFLIVLDENGKRANAARSNAAESGYYFLTGLRPGQKYTINIGQKEYFKEQFPIEIPNTDSYVEISRDFLIKPLEVGAKIPFRVPPFELNKSKLRVGADEILNNMANALLLNPDVKVEIQSFPDDADDKNANQQLTKERAQSVIDFFIEKGIDKSRLTFTGSANVDPKNPPPTEKRAKGKRYVGTTYVVVKSF